MSADAVTNPTKEVVREATASDIPEIVSLINRAFVVERFFKNADRTNAETVEEHMRDGNFLLLRKNEELFACAYVKVTGDRAYLGMLSVDPARQKSGLGRHMMLEVEAYARAAGCKVMEIRIVNLRSELPPMYRKFGFAETGEESAEGIENVTQPIHFITMSKALDPA
jgi:N-acetylglutamate synthase-like GNAT family acetyltransferase